MHKLILILFVLLYIDDVYFWVDRKDMATPVDYTVLQGARKDSITRPATNQEKIEVIHAQDTTVTVVVHRN